MKSENVFIGLGANLHEPEQQLISAFKALSNLPGSTLAQFSSLYSSKPLGPQEQPDYVNAIALLQTHLQPLELLDQLQAIEKQHGRVRKSQRWGARTLDLDMILFGQYSIKSERLTVPHYHFKQREFVLYPLYELTPELLLPDGQPLRKVLQNVPRNGLTIIKHQNQLSLD